MLVLSLELVLFLSRYVASFAFCTFCASLGYNLFHCRLFLSSVVEGACPLLTMRATWAGTSHESNTFQESQCHALAICSKRMQHCTIIICMIIRCMVICCTVIRCTVVHRRIICCLIVRKSLCSLEFSEYPVRVSPKHPTHVRPLCATWLADRDESS